MDEIYHYVPLLDMLKAILSHKEIRDAICKPKISSGSSIRSYIDGKLYKKNRILNKENSLCLKFYIDDFEPANPLGEMKGDYK